MTTGRNNIEDGVAAKTPRWPLHKGKNQIDDRRQKLLEPRRHETGWGRAPVERGAALESTFLFLPVCFATAPSFLLLKTPLPDMMTVPGRRVSGCLMERWIRWACNWAGRRGYSSRPIKVIEFCSLLLCMTRFTLHFFCSYWSMIGVDRLCSIFQRNRGFFVVAKAPEQKAPKQGSQYSITNARRQSGGRTWDRCCGAGTTGSGIGRCPCVTGL